MARARSVTAATGEILFNCCTGNLPPDWGELDAIEVNPCVTDPEGDGEVIGLESAAESVAYGKRVPDFWTVYGHIARDSKIAKHGGGGVEAISDFRTERLARAAALLFEEIIKRARSGR